MGNVGGSLRRMREAGCQIRNGSRPRVKCWQGLVSDNFRFPPKFRFRARIRLKVILRARIWVKVRFKILGKTRGTFKARGMYTVTGE